MILLLLWKRASYAGSLAGMLTGFAVAIAWKVFAQNQFHGVEVYNLPFAFVCSLLVNVTFSWIWPSLRHATAAA